MPWTGEFIRRLGEPVVTPIYILEAITLPGSGRPRPLGGNMALSSIASRFLPGYQGVLSLDSSRVSYGQLQIGEWSYTLAEWEIGLLSQDIGPYDVRDRTVRGQIVALRMGFPGWDVESYQQIGIGVVQDVVRRGESWSIQIRSFLASLINRWTTSSAQQSLFHTLNSTTLDSAYTAGSGNCVVVSSTGSDRETAGANQYMIRISPSGGDPFIVTATGRSLGPPDTFTGLSAGLFGTTDADASAGDVVEMLAYIQDHPFEVIRKVLTSTGAGTNGPFDTLPASWGLGVDDELIDDGDCRDHVFTSTPLTGAGVWDVYSTEPQQDCLAWMSYVLAQAGGFLVERQGRISIRGASVPFVQPGVTRQWTVYDRDVVSVDQYSTYDPSMPAEFARVRLVDPRAGTTDLSEQVQSFPSGGSKRIDLDFVDTDRTAWRESIRDRIAYYWLRIGEPVTLTLRGLSHAQMAVGDHLILEMDRQWLSGRRRGHGTTDITDSQAMLLTSVQPDWFGATTTVECVLVPPLESE